MLGGVRDTIGATDLPLAELQCLRSLVRLEPNVGVVNAFLKKTLARLGELEGGGTVAGSRGAGIGLSAACRRAA